MTADDPLKDYTDASMEIAKLREEIAVLKARSAECPRCVEHARNGACTRPKCMCCEQWMMCVLCGWYGGER